MESPAGPLTEGVGARAHERGRDRHAQLLVPKRDDLPTRLYGVLDGSEMVVEQQRRRIEVVDRIRESEEGGGPVTGWLGRTDELDDDLARPKERLEERRTVLIGLPGAAGRQTDGFECRDRSALVRGEHDDVVDHQRSVRVVGRSAWWPVAGSGGQAIQVRIGALGRRPAAQRPPDDPLPPLAADEADPDVADPTRRVVVHRETRRPPGIGLVGHDDVVDCDGFRRDGFRRDGFGCGGFGHQRDGSPPGSGRPPLRGGRFEHGGSVWADCTAVTGTVNTLHEQAHAWMSVDPDPATRAEVGALLARGDDAGLAERFGTALTFGTAGLRGAMGAGPNRMNRVVVRRATAGLMDHLPPGAGVVIGHDSRLNSHVFAEDAARVVAGAGGHALVLPCFAPTPLVAYAVRHLAADAGVVCTASHNPPNDNGYKVYLADGAQILPPTDALIADAIDRSQPVLASEGHARIEMLDDGVERAYVEHVAGLRSWSPAKRDVRVVYSALHGVGTRLTAAVFEAAGFAPLHLVDAQCSPDGTFPTVAVPNPELIDSTRLARRELARSGADVALVHDPDADRLGVMVRHGADVRRLTGDEIGLLLGDHVLRHGAGTDRLVVDTVVSSNALAAVAAAHGVHHHRTLTGFKWIVRPAIEHPGLRFVFGYEEALGFSVDPYVRDKDAISAALVFADLVATLAADGHTVNDRLEELANRHGLFATATWTWSAGMTERVTRAMSRLRSALPRAIGHSKVVAVRDYVQGGTLPPTDLLELELEPRARLCVRPSGTEAKLKVYAEVVVPTDDGAPYARATAESSTRLEALHTAIVPLVDMLMND